MVSRPVGSVWEDEVMCAHGCASCEMLACKFSLRRCCGVECILLCAVTAGGGYLLYRASADGADTAVLIEPEVHERVRDTAMRMWRLAAADLTFVADLRYVMVSFSPRIFGRLDAAC